jgi:hypothetical protein
MRNTKKSTEPKFRVKWTWIISHPRAFNTPDQHCYMEKVFDTLDAAVEFAYAKKAEETAKELSYDGVRFDGIELFIPIDMEFEAGVLQECITAEKTEQQRRKDAWEREHEKQKEEKDRSEYVRLKQKFESN